MSSKIIVINDIEYEPQPSVCYFVFDCKCCWFYNKDECDDVPCIEEKCFYIPKEL